MEGVVSSNEVVRNFFQGPRGGYIDYVPLCIKMLLVERGMMSMESDTMVD